MNEYDSQLIQTILTKAKYKFVRKESDADIIMLNTCSVRENANRKIFGLVHYLRYKFKDKPLIGILGCMATDKKETLLTSKNLRINFIAGPDSYRKLPKLIKNAQKNKKALDIELSETETYSNIYPTRKESINAGIAISRGCNNFCTYCIVPYVRGRERSRNFKEIISEARKLSREGFPQITLLGQNVNSYHYDGKNFPDLFEKISKVKGIKRIQFMSPHPKDFPDKLINTLATNSKAYKCVHLPLQSGNSRILKMMNRTYSKINYLNLVKRIKSACPGIAITTDIIVGFPTETNKEFNDTVRVLKKVCFDAAFIFKYSPREGTAAKKKYPDDISSEIKTKRIVLLNKIQRQISAKNNEKLIGSAQELIVESKDKNNPKENFWGRTNTNKIVSFKGKNCCQGDFVQVKITSASAFGLKGKLIASP